MLSVAADDMGRGSGLGCGKARKRAPVVFTVSSWAGTWGQLSLTCPSLGHLSLQKQGWTEAPHHPIPIYT